MKTTNKLKFLFFFLFFIPQLAGAVCSMSLTLDPSFVVFGYTGSAVTVNVNVIVTRSEANGNCKDFRLYFTKGASADYNRKLDHLGTTLNYNIFKNNQLTRILKDLPDVVNNNDFIDNNFNGNQLTKTITIFTNLAASPLNTVMRGGIYADTVTAKLYRDSGGFILANTFSFNLSTLVPREVNISLVDSGSPFNVNDTFQFLDFQELESNESKTFDLKVYSNAGFSLAFSSINNGKLKNGTSTIDYDLKVNGVTQNLSNSSGTPVEVAQGTGITPAGGINHAIMVTIGNVSNKMAGTYNDYITVVATAIE